MGSLSIGNPVPLSPVNVEGFSGVRLDLDPEEAGLGSAIDALNVEFDREGRVRSRDGFTKVTASAGASRYDSVFPVAGAASVTAASASAGTFADDSSHGTTTWSFTGGALPATTSLPAGATSHYVKATNFGFAVPSTATIIGVVVSVTRSGGLPNAIFDDTIKLIKAGVVSGSDRAGGGTGWQAGADTRLVGSPADLWGVTLTPANVNAATFGVVFAGINSATTTLVATVSAITITVYYQPLGSVLVAGAAGSRLDVIATDGTVSATLATASDTRQSYVAFGSPATSAVYIANSGVTIRKLVGTTFSAPAGMPKAKFVGLQSGPDDNRLVAANIATIPTGAGSTASTSLVHFSDPGAPETWGANNYVYLTPGDNEDIKALTTWRNQVFIFKGSRFFVFYGNSVNSTGNPVFNYREVTGAGVITDQAACSSPEGVYFLDRRGVYLTTGGPPVKVSGAIDPLFSGASVPFFTPGVINPSAFGQATMAYYNNRLHLGVPLGVATANSHTLVYNPQTQVWTVWDIPMGAMVSSLTQPALLYFTYATGTNDIGAYLSNGYSDDAGTAITSRYRSGFSDLGLPGREKTIRQTELIGQGTISLGWARDLGAITSTSTGNVTLGTAPASARGMHRLSQNGELLGYQISSVSGAWQANRVTPFVRRPRDPGEKSA